MPSITAVFGPNAIQTLEDVASAEFARRRAQGGDAGGGVAPASSASASLPHVDDCSICMKCHVDHKPAARLISTADLIPANFQPQDVHEKQTKPLCPECRGCTHDLQLLVHTCYAHYKVHMLRMQCIHALNIMPYVYLQGWIRHPSQTSCLDQVAEAG